jgi:hypothetical protein
MLMVIFGAGASYDSSPDFLPPNPEHFVPAPPIPCRPPLAAELFLDSNGAFRDIVQNYRKLLPILPHLRRPSNGRSVEQELESWEAEASEDPERKRQLFSVRYYLHDLLLRISDEWLRQTSGVTNYVTLLDQIRHVNTAGEAVSLVTFNYDLLLDRALLSFDYKQKDPENEFDAHPIFKLLKPHGSVDWARYIDITPNTKLGIEQIIERADSIRLTNKYLRANATDPHQMFKFDRPVVPAIAVPVQTKTEDTFEWPQSQCATLEQFLPSVTKVLIIGWQAREAHFLSKLRLAHPRPKLTHLMVVGRNARDADATLNHLIEEIGPHAAKFYLGQEGFTQFVLNHEGKAFLAG